MDESPETVAAASVEGDSLSFATVAGLADADAPPGELPEVSSVMVSGSRFAILMLVMPRSWRMKKIRFGVAVNCHVCEAVCPGPEHVQMDVTAQDARLHCQHQANGHHAPLPFYEPADFTCRLHRIVQTG
ncbi:MAG: hypothetical protein AAB658_07600, partial [Chloroflexota bacterium]